MAKSPLVLLNQVDEPTVGPVFDLEDKPMRVLLLRQEPSIDAIFDPNDPDNQLADGPLITIARSLDPTFPGLSLDPWSPDHQRTAEWTQLNNMNLAGTTPVLHDVFLEDRMIVLPYIKAIWRGKMGTGNLTLKLFFE